MHNIKIMKEHTPFTNAKKCMQEFAKAALMDTATSIERALIRRRIKKLRQNIQKCLETANHKKIKKLINRYAQSHQTSAILSNISFPDNIDLSKTDFLHARLNKCSFAKTKLTNSKFEHARAHNANFSDAICNKANFSHADLENTSFNNSDLKNSNFYKANLTNVDLRDADLRNAYFESANLDGADLRGAKVDADTLAKIYHRNKNVKLSITQMLKINFIEYEHYITDTKTKNSTPQLVSHYQPTFFSIKKIRDISQTPTHTHVVYGRSEIPPEYDF